MAFKCRSLGDTWSTKRKRTGKELQKVRPASNVDSVDMWISKIPATIGQMMPNTWERGKHSKWRKMKIAECMVSAKAPGDFQGSSLARSPCKVEATFFRWILHKIVTAILHMWVNSAVALWTCCPRISLVSRTLVSSFLRQLFPSILNLSACRVAEVCDFDLVSQSSRDGQSALIEKDHL